MNELTHYGVKGQKWGVRHDRKATGRWGRLAKDKKEKEKNTDSKSSASHKKIGAGFERAFFNRVDEWGDVDPDVDDDFAKKMIADKEYQQVMKPVVKEALRSKSLFDEYHNSGDKDAWDRYVDSGRDLDKACYDVGVKTGFIKEGPEEFDRSSLFNYVAACYVDKVTGEPFIGDSLIHSLMGGNMYVNGTTLILGDTSASLAHHGVKGQKWGVRRFQNRDGSLTANGRKRLGYAAKSAKSGITGAVKKTYAIGKHTAVRLKTGVGSVFSAGKKAAVASKNAVKKVNDYRIEKKKEKASQSRAGVMKNKKLFTNKELKELSERFDIEDQITLNGVKKGAEVVQNVASSLTSVALAAKAGAEAYKSFTGDTLIEGRGEKRDVRVAEAEKKWKEAETILKNKSKQMTDIIKKQKEITSQKVNAAENKAKAADERVKAVKSKEKDLSDREEALSNRERESVKFDRETNDRAKDLNARERQSNDRERELNERDRDVSAKNQRADDYLQRATAMMRAVDQRSEEVEAANAGRDIAAREISRALAESEARNVQLENRLNNEKNKKRKK